MTLRQEQGRPVAMADAGTGVGAMVGAAEHLP